MGWPVAIRNAFLDGQILSTYYLALYTTLPDNEGAGGVEVSGNGYARVQLSDIAAAASGNKTNGADIEFPVSTGAWGTIVGYGVYSAITAGTFKGRSDTFSGQTVDAANQTIRIAAGELDFNFNNPA